VFDGELDVGNAGGLQALELARVRHVRGGLHALGELFEAGVNQRRDERGSIREVMVRSGVRDAGAAGHFAQGEVVDATLFQELRGGLEQGAAQIPVVIAIAAARRGSPPIGWRHIRGQS
jgi:hypothetical protein